jgi:hypothetical protein
MLKEVFLRGSRKRRKDDNCIFIMLLQFKHCGFMREKREGKRYAT